MLLTPRAGSAGTQPLSVATPDRRITSNSRLLTLLLWFRARHTVSPESAHPISELAQVAGAVSFCSTLHWLHDILGVAFSSLVKHDAEDLAVNVLGNFALRVPSGRQDGLLQHQRPCCAPHQRPNHAPLLKSVEQYRVVDLKHHDQVKPPASSAGRFHFLPPEHLPATQPRTVPGRIRSCGSLPHCHQQTAAPQVRHTPGEQRAQVKCRPQSCDSSTVRRVPCLRPQCGTGTPRPSRSAGSAPE